MESKIINKFPMSHPVPKVSAIQMIFRTGENGCLDQCFSTYGDMVHDKFQEGHRNFITFTGPQLTEWSIKLLLTTSPSINEIKCM